MTADNNQIRWELLQVSVKDESFTMLDKLANKKRMYHVPHLLHAELTQQIIYIFTSNSKVMQLNLLTAARHFLSASELKKLTQVQKIHQSLQIKKTSAKKVKRSMINIKSLPSYAFSNTIISY